MAQPQRRLCASELALVSRRSTRPYYWRWRITVVHGRSPVERPPSLQRWVPARWIRGSFRGGFAV